MVRVQESWRGMRDSRCEMRGAGDAELATHPSVCLINHFWTACSRGSKVSDHFSPTILEHPSFTPVLSWPPKCLYSGATNYPSDIGHLKKVLGKTGNFNGPWLYEVCEDNPKQTNGAHHDKPKKESDHPEQRDRTRK